VDLAEDVIQDREEVFIQDPEAEPIPAQVVVCIPVLAEGCTQAPEVGFIPAPVVVCIPALEEVYTRDREEGFIQAPGEVSTVAPVVVCIAGREFLIPVTSPRGKCSFNIYVEPVITQLPI